MDKLRALQYFAAAAQGRSFSAAARALEVSVPAVAKSVNALERDLGVRLFERNSHGLTLTAGGAAYLEGCTPALQQLAEADEQARSAALRLRGKVVVGVQHVVARGVLAAALPRFHARHPEIELDIRDIVRATPEHTDGLDVLLVLGWPKLKDLVQRRIGTSRLVVVASPAYWALHGMPQRPKDLERHSCLRIRSVGGTPLDLWSFERGGERESVTVGGWLTTSNAHRDLAMALALAGEGVMRVLDWSNLAEQRSGALVRALDDWDSPDAPPVNLFYRASVRRAPRVRLFIEFIAEVFAELERARGRP